MRPLDIRTQDGETYPVRCVFLRKKIVRRLKGQTENGTRICNGLPREGGGPDSAFLFETTARRRYLFDFAPGGVSEFGVLGIDHGLGLDPDNTPALITGLTTLPGRVKSAVVAHSHPLRRVHGAYNEGAKQRPRILRAAGPAQGRLGSHQLLPVVARPLEEVGTAPRAAGQMQRHEKTIRRQLVLLDAARRRNVATVGALSPVSSSMGDETPLDGGSLDRLLQLFERAHFDLANPFA